MENITYLTKRGFKPVFNIIDNEASKSVKKYLEEENAIIQLVGPHNYYINAAERVIQTFKNHTIAGLPKCGILIVWVCAGGSDHIQCFLCLFN